MIFHKYIKFPCPFTEIYVYLSPDDDFSHSFGKFSQDTSVVKAIFA